MYFHDYTPYGKEYNIPVSVGSKFRIGRNPYGRLCDIVVQDARVSSVHCTLSCISSKEPTPSVALYTICDESRNGTWLLSEKSVIRKLPKGQPSKLNNKDIILVLNEKNIGKVVAYQFFFDGRTALLKSCESSNSTKRRYSDLTREEMKLNSAGASEPTMRKAMDSERLDKRVKHDGIESISHKTREREIFPSGDGAREAGVKDTIYLKDNVTDSCISKQGMEKSMSKEELGGLLEKHECGASSIPVRECKECGKKLPVVTASLHEQDCEGPSLELDPDAEDDDVRVVKIINYREKELIEAVKEKVTNKSIDTNANTEDAVCTVSESSRDTGQRVAAEVMGEKSKDSWKNRTKKSNAITFCLGGDDVDTDDGKDAVIGNVVDDDGGRNVVVAGGVALIGHGGVDVSDGNNVIDGNDDDGKGVIIEKHDDADGGRDAVDDVLTGHGGADVSDGNNVIDGNDDDGKGAIIGNDDDADGGKGDVVTGGVALIGRGGLDYVRDGVGNSKNDVVFQGDDCVVHCNNVDNDGRNDDHPDPDVDHRDKTAAYEEEKGVPALDIDSQNTYPYSLPSNIRESQIIISDDESIHSLEENENETFQTYHETKRCGSKNDDILILDADIDVDFGKEPLPAKRISQINATFTSSDANSHGVINDVAPQRVGEHFIKGEKETKGTLKLDSSSSAIEHQVDSTALEPESRSLLFAEDSSRLIKENSTKVCTEDESTVLTVLSKDESKERCTYCGEMVRVIDIFTHTENCAKISSEVCYGEDGYGDGRDCPFCGIYYTATALPEHIDRCSRDYTSSPESDDWEKCRICGEVIGATEFETHTCYDSRDRRPPDFDREEDDEDEDEEEEEEGDNVEACPVCGKHFEVDKLVEHANICVALSKDADRKAKEPDSLPESCVVDTPTEANETPKSTIRSQIIDVECPLCFLMFPAGTIEEHCISCSDPEISTSTAVLNQDCETSENEGDGIDGAEMHDFSTKQKPTSLSDRPSRLHDSSKSCKTSIENKTGVTTCASDRDVRERNCPVIKTAEKEENDVRNDVHDTRPVPSPSEALAEKSQEDKRTDRSSSADVECPICFVSFPLGIIEGHAVTCNGPEIVTTVASSSRDGIHVGSTYEGANNDQIMEPALTGTKRAFNAESDRSFDPRYLSKRRKVPVENDCVTSVILDDEYHSQDIVSTPEDTKVSFDVSSSATPRSTKAISDIPTDSNLNSGISNKLSAPLLTKASSVTSYNGCEEQCAFCSRGFPVGQLVDHVVRCAKKASPSRGTQSQGDELEQCCFCFQHFPLKELVEHAQQCDKKQESNEVNARCNTSRKCKNTRLKGSCLPKRPRCVPVYRSCICTFFSVLLFYFVRIFVVKSFL